LKQPLLTLILLFLATAAVAQEFDIRSFSAVPNDLSARKEVRRTVNDEPCALIKVVTNIKGMQFESNIGIVDVEHQADGYWLYVAPRERRIRLMASGYLSRDVAMPEPAKELIVYELVVAATGTGARGQNSELISVTFRLNEDNVFIRSGGNAPVAASGRSAVFFVPEGLHNFTFSKSGFEEESLEIDVRETTVRDVEMRPGEGSASMSLSGFVVITSEPAGAEVFLNDQRVGTTPYQGRHVPGAYSLALRSYQYYDHTESFTLDQGATYQLPQIALKPQFGFVSIRTTPADAEVLINDKPVGTAPVSRRKLGSGYHSIKVRKSLYHENAESFTLEDGEEKSLDIALKSAFGSLKITSDPSGAEVYVDEVHVGTTPYTNEMQASGTYNVRVEEELYAPARSAITVSDGQESEKFFALTANFGTLTVESPDAEIFIDGKLAGSDRISQQLAPGNYKLEARRDKHDTDSKDVFVMVGNAETVTLEPRPRMGALSIMTEPFEASGAEIWIDGKKTEYKTPAVVEMLEGEYVIELKKTEYGTQSKSFEVEQGEQLEWVAQLYQTGPRDVLDEKNTIELARFSAKIRSGGLKYKNSEDFAVDALNDFNKSNINFNGRLEFRRIGRRVEGSAFTNLYLTKAKPAGPGNAVLSMMLPGWGTLKVSGGEKGRGRMLLFGITAGTAVGSRLVSNHRYEKYRTNVSMDNRNALYKEANLLNQISWIASAMAVSISLYDVIWVINKGVENRRKSKPLREQLKKGWIYVE